MAPKRASSLSSANTVAFPSSKTSTAKGSSSAKKNVASSTKSATAPQAASTVDDGFDPYDPAYSALFKESKKLMGTPVHGEGFTPVDVILKVFDTTDEYGPTSNLTRLERYERAKMLGLEPPPELGALLRACPASYARSGFQI